MSLESIIHPNIFLFLFLSNNMLENVVHLCIAKVFSNFLALFYFLVFFFLNHRFPDSIFSKCHYLTKLVIFFNPNTCYRQLCPEKLSRKFKLYAK